MERIKDQIAMDGFSAANLRKGLDGEIATKIAAVEAAVQKGMTAANLRAALVEALTPTTPPSSPREPSPY